MSLKSANLKNGRIKTTESGKEETIDWVVNQDGDAVARIDTRGSDEKLAIFAKAPGNSSLKRVADIDLTTGPVSKVQFFGVAERAGILQALTTDQAGVQKLVEFDVETGAFGDALFDNNNGQIDTIAYDARRNKATVIYYNNGSPQAYHLIEADRMFQASLERAIEGAAIAIKSVSTNGERMIVKALYANKPSEYYYYDIPGNRLELIVQE